MGCWHGHGPWCDWPPPRGWYGPSLGASEWSDESSWPGRRRRERRDAAADRPSAAQSLEARLDELRDEIARVEADLTELRRSAGQAADEG